MRVAFRWLIGLSVLAGLALVWTQRELLGNYEEPRHRVVREDGNVEIRHYDPVVAAEVVVRRAGRRAASYEAFTPLFGYISGQNTTQAEIAMTAPVTTNATGDGESIAMTAPVTQVPAQDGWRVRFFLPDAYTLDTAPTPTNPDVKLVEVPARRVVAIRFSGWASDDSLDEHLARLKAYVEQQSLTPVGEPVLAQYNSPFVLPFLRRNELIWQLASEGNGSV